MPGYANRPGGAGAMVLGKAAVVGAGKTDYAAWCWNGNRCGKSSLLGAGRMAFVE